MRPPASKKNIPPLQRITLKEENIFRSPTRIQNFHMFECVWPFCGIGACRVNKVKSNNNTGVVLGLILHLNNTKLFNILKSSNEYTLFQEKYH